MRQKGFFWGAAAAATAACLLSGCSSKEHVAENGHRVVAVCTISVVEDLVRNVGKDLVETSALVTGLENPHTFSPTPGDSKTIARADLFFEIGLGLEPWAEKFVEASGNKNLRVVVLSEGIETIAAGLAEEENDEEAHLEEHDSSHHGGANPHIWMDPENGAEIVDSIAHALSEADPDNAAAYRANATEYKQRLSGLAQAIRSRAAEVKNRSVATHAPAFSYLLRFLGLKEAVRVQLTAAEEPPAKRVYVTPLLTDDPENDTYLEMIETTATKIIDALESD
jgi:ABC-type Zn uptake system ZnuABC Zn-binding protein ZnuA